MTDVNDEMKTTSKLTPAEVEEYCALRNEIITYINAKQNLIYLSVLVVLALLGLQITTKQYLFSLCTIVTIFVFYKQDMNYKIGLAECGAYIRARFEDRSNELHWETILSRINDKYDHSNKTKTNTKKITKEKTKKYTSFFRSIFDSGIINHFTAFSIISLVVGWFPLLEKITTSKLCANNSVEVDIANIIIMGLATLITLSFIIYIISIKKRDFNCIRGEFYSQIKKLLKKVRFD